MRQRLMPVQARTKPANKKVNIAMADTLRAIIVDDEAPARAVIRKYLQDFPGIVVIGECDNGFAAIKLIQTGRPEMVFLDIQMPRLTGFELLELLEDPPVIIFTTAYDQYALRAFEVSAADYLLKPFSRARFGEAIQKALRLVQHGGRRQRQIKNVLTAHRQEREPLERIAVKDGSKISVIPVVRLVRIEAMGDYVMLHTTMGKFLKQQPLKYFAAHLDAPEFLQVHRSHIVRIMAIREVAPLGNGTAELRLADDSRVPVSRSGYRRLQEVLGL